MKKGAFTFVALLCFVSVCLAAIGSVSGKWNGNITGPTGEEEILIYNLKADGDKLTGTVESHGAEMAVDSGKVNGTIFKFSITNPEGTVIPHTGKYYAAGDSCSLDINYQGMKFHTTLKRAADK